MADYRDTHATIEVGAEGGDAHHGETGVLDVSGSMLLWTWVTFLIVAALLYKLAWKPILAALDEREKHIRDSVDNAERVSRELATIDEQRGRIIRGADEQAKSIVSASRKAASEAARVIENQAKEESQILIENAQREIKAAEEKAAAALRRESADVAVALASRIIGEQLDETRNKALTDKLLKEL